MSAQSNQKNWVGELIVAFLAILLSTVIMAAFLFGAFDNEGTWTASDMRGEVQRRLERLERREASAKHPWQLLRIQAERDELLAIVEPYDSE